MGKNFRLTCLKCRLPVRYTIEEMREARERGYFICKRCSEKISTNLNFDKDAKAKTE